LGVEVERVTEEDMVQVDSVFDGEDEGEPDVENLDDLKTLKWGTVVEDEAYEFLTPPLFTGHSGPTEDTGVIGTCPPVHTCILGVSLACVVAVLRLCCVVSCCAQDLLCC
jgi:hypothetical protein